MSYQIHSHILMIWVSKSSTSRLSCSSIKIIPILKVIKMSCKFVISYLIIYDALNFSSICQILHIASSICNDISKATNLLPRISRNWMSWIQSICNSSSPTSICLQQIFDVSIEECFRAILSIRSSMEHWEKDVRLSSYRWL